MNEMARGAVHDLLELLRNLKLQEAREVLKQEREKLNRREVTSLRETVNEIVRSIIVLDAQINKITISYNDISRHCPEDLISGISEYIEELKREKVRLEIAKHSAVRRR
ncbi:hypothetical protein NSS98_06900 [Paenibacillus sp. FSL E2-0274]|nr:hypothetical protein [Paenibacillus odorifer]